MTGYRGKIWGKYTYGPVPDPLFMDYLKLRISRPDMRVLLFIIRKTIGWDKEWDRISYTQFEEATGLERRNIGRSLRSLLDKNLIEIKPNKNSKSYKIVVETGFLSLSKRVPAIANVATESYKQNSNGIVANVATTKNIIYSSKKGTQEDSLGVRLLVSYIKENRDWRAGLIEKFGEDKFEKACKKAVMIFDMDPHFTFFGRRVWSGFIEYNKKGNYNWSKLVEDEIGKL